MSSEFENERLLDTTGWRLLCELQENARLSFAELGRRVGLTPPAVADRMRRFEESGIISGYRTEINTARLGLSLTAYINYTVSRQSQDEAIALIRSLQEVLECHRLTGADGFLMKVVVASVEHLEILVDRLSQHGTTTTSIIISSQVKRRSIETELVEKNVLQREYEAEAVAE